LQLTVTVKLNTTPEAHAALVKTMQACNAACDRIRQSAWDSQTFRQYDRHKLVYHPVKAETGLAAGHVVCAIARVANAYKLDTDTLRLNRAVRTELNAWAFLQLKMFLHYKAKRAGVTLIEVDLRYSSQICSACGHCERANRKSLEHFERQCCGFQAHADFNTSLNLKARGELSAALMFRQEALASS